MIINYLVKHITTADVYWTGIQAVVNCGYRKSEITLGRLVVPEAAQSSSFLRFGAFELDLRAGELRRQGLKIKLQEKPLRILAILVEHSGEVVTREELREQLWPADTFVDFDHSINTAINKLREALGDSAENPRLIETLPRHGYRFIGPVGPSNAVRPPPPAQEPKATTTEAGLRIVHTPKSGDKAPSVAVRLPAGLARPRGRAALYIAGTILASLLLVVGLAVGPSFFNKSAAPHMRVVPLTSFPGREDHPSFSPDGNQIAFEWTGEKEDNYDIYVKVIGADSTLRLTTNPAADRAPAWSPDGRYIAFLRHTQSEDGIYLIPALGGTERKLYSPRLGHLWGFERLDWSPDGKFLAFSEVVPGEEHLRIAVLSVETLEKRVVTTPPPSSLYGDLGPRYSTNGQMLAFQRYSAPGIIDAYVVPAAGGEPVRLTKSAFVDGLAWTPEGTNLIYSSDRGDSSGLWNIRAAGGAAERLSLGTEDAYHLALSRYGRRLAYVRTSEDQNIWRFDVSRSQNGTAPPTRLIASTRLDAGPQFSPDGSKIVFTSARSGNCCEIWVSRSDGSRATQVTHFDGPLAGTPRWSPDGREIAFDCDAGGSADIYVVAAEGGQPRRLTTDRSTESAPSWSRDGRWIYFASDRTRTWQVWKIPAEGGKAVQVTEKGGFAAFESYDGKTLYYAKGQLAPGLWKKPVEGGEETLVLNQLLSGLWGYWGLTRRGIFFYDAGTGAIEFYSFATRKISRVATPEQGPYFEYPGFSISPDGRWILYTQVDTSSSNIMLVENFHW
jgi:Tol biopolymer transport system component/DNA-binding winged helix-turn-helix (wHTH) protein